MYRLMRQRYDLVAQTEFRESIAYLVSPRSAKYNSEHKARLYETTHLQNSIPFMAGSLRKFSSGLLRSPQGTCLLSLNFLCRYMGLDTYIQFSRALHLFLETALR